VIGHLSVMWRRETICSPPTAVRLAADLRPSADGSAVRTWLSYRQPACLQPRAAARLGLGQTDGRTAVSLNTPPPTADGIISDYSFKDACAI